MAMVAVRVCTIISSRMHAGRQAGWRLLLRGLGIAGGVTAGGGHGMTAGDGAGGRQGIITATCMRMYAGRPVAC